MYDWKKLLYCLFVNTKKSYPLFLRCPIKFCDKSDLAILTFRSPGRGSSARVISYRSYCKNVLFCLNTSFKLLNEMIQTKYVDDKLGSVHQNCKFHDPMGDD